MRPDEGLLGLQAINLKISHLASVAPALENVEVQLSTVLGNHDMVLVYRYS